MRFVRSQAVNTADAPGKCGLRDGWFCVFSHYHRLGLDGNSHRAPGPCWSFNRHPPGQTSDFLMVVWAACVGNPAPLVATKELPNPNHAWECPKRSVPWSANSLCGSGKQILDTYWTGSIPISRAEVPLSPTRSRPRLYYIEQVVYRFPAQTIPYVPPGLGPDYTTCPRSRVADIVNLSPAPFDPGHAALRIDLLLICLLICC